MEQARFNLLIWPTCSLPGSSSPPRPGWSRSRPGSHWRPGRWWWWEGYKCQCGESGVVGHQRAVGGNCWAQHWGQCTAYCLLCLHPANTRPQHHRGDNGARQTNPHLLHPAGPLTGAGLALDHSTAGHSTPREAGRDQDWEGENGQVGISHLPLVLPDPDAGDAVLGVCRPRTTVQLSLTELIPSTSCNNTILYLENSSRPAPHQKTSLKEGNVHH